jgi:hypothetical protein
MAQYFDVHVFHSRNDGFSVPMAILDRNEGDSFDEDEIIEMAVRHRILDAEDSLYVDSVDDITEIEYNDMKGI